MTSRYWEHARGAGCARRALRRLARSRAGQGLQRQSRYVAGEAAGREWRMKRRNVKTRRGSGFLAKPTSEIIILVHEGAGTHRCARRQDCRVLPASPHPQVGVFRFGAARRFRVRQRRGCIDRVRGGSRCRTDPACRNGAWTGSAPVHCTERRSVALRRGLFDQRGESTPDRSLSELQLPFEFGRGHRFFFKPVRRLDEHIRQVA